MASMYNALAMIFTAPVHYFLSEINHHGFIRPQKALLCITVIVDQNLPGVLNAFGIS